LDKNYSTINVQNATLIIFTAVVYHIAVVHLLLVRLNLPILFAYWVVLHIISLFYFLVLHNGISLFTMGARSELIDKEIYLNELFCEVYRDAERINPKISRKVKLYIMEDTDVNAFALNNSIILTNGAINSLSAGEIKGIFAHEFGHISNHYAKVRFFLSGSMITVKLLLIFLNSLKHMYAVLAAIIVKSPDYLIAPYFRNNEYYADEFARLAGYGSELISVLEVFRQLEISGSRTLSEKLLATHPKTVDRIKKLEENLLAFEKKTSQKCTDKYEAIQSPRLRAILNEVDKSKKDKNYVMKTVDGLRIEKMKEKNHYDIVRPEE